VVIVDFPLFTVEIVGETTLVETGGSLNSDITSDAVDAVAS
jgi:hypothetical protein